MKTEERSKKIAGERAADFVQQGMVIGLGTGSTVYWVIQKLAERVKEGLHFQAVPTSTSTERLAREAGIPIVPFEQVQQFDLTIDGADEINQRLDMVKGGGGALLREKLVAIASKKLVIVVDSSKLVSSLGGFPLPVEIVPFSSEHTLKRIESTGCKATLRKATDADRIFITDNGNYIADCHFREIRNPQKLHDQLKMLPGVIETGLFVNLADTVIVGYADRYEVLPKDNRTAY